VRFEFLTSTPLTPTEGSGTFVAIDGLVRGLASLGHTVAVRPLGTRTGFHTLDRWLYNAGVVLAPPSAQAAHGARNVRLRPSASPLNCIDVLIMVPSLYGVSLIPFSAGIRTYPGLAGPQTSRTAP